MAPMFDGVDIVDINGHTSNKEKYEILEKVYFECENGFNLVGPEKSSCQFDGEWDVNEENKPVCDGN